MTKNHERINELFEELVPESGKAGSLAGAGGAIRGIGYRWYNDGDQVGIGCNGETCNPPDPLPDPQREQEVGDLAASIWGIST